MMTTLRCTLLVGFIMIIAFSCKNKSPEMSIEQNFPSFYKEGHRGARGLMPENTIPSMIKAVEVGANILELDVHISRDGQVVVAHDPYMNRSFTLLPSGEEIPQEDAKKYILHQLDYADIRRFDVGSKYHSGFPEQKKVPAYIPLLGELIDSVEQYTASKKLPPVIYNIEVKADPQFDGVYQPVPEELIKRVMDVVTSKNIGNRFYVQSFDVRQIQEVHQRYPQVVIGFLTGDAKASFEENLTKIGFKPHIYSPHYKIATPALVQKCHEQNIKFVPWTVNTLDEMRELKEMGVDGIITDYPNLLQNLE